MFALKGITYALKTKDNVSYKIATVLNRYGITCNVSANNYTWHRCHDAVTVLFMGSGCGGKCQVLWSL